MSETYYDSLIDCTLMIGVNEYSGLKLSLQDNMDINSQSSVKYQQHILAAISSSVAIFPFSKSNCNYPPEDFKRSEPVLEVTETKPVYSRQFSREELHIIHDLVNHYNQTDIREQIQDPDFTLSLNRRASRYKSRRKSLKLISLDNYSGTLGSVSIETIKAFPGTYFNSNLKVSEIYIKPKIEILPMTDNLGSRSYAFRLEFFRHFVKTEETLNENDNTKEIKIDPVIETDLDSSKYVYLPCNIVFFSKYPYFNLFKDILSQLFLSINNANTKFIEEEILEYSSILTRIPIMQFENIQINFTIDRKTYSIKPNSPIFDQIIDWDISLLFQTLSIDDILFLLTAMFQEQKIAFFSDYPNTTTIICETLLLLFQPFTWKHFYLTVVPSHLYELVDAIFPFLIGLPHKMKEKVIKSYDDIIVVDLDEGTINTPKECHVVSISTKLISQLKVSLREREWLTERHNLSCISPSSFEDWRMICYKNNKAFSEKIMLQFMMMMVDLFREILINISVDNKNETLVVKNLDKFLATSHSENIELFKSIKDSDNFNCFLDSKLRKRDTDSWVKVCDQMYPDLLEHLRFQALKIGKSKKNSIQFERGDNIQLVEDEHYVTVDFPTSRYDRKAYYKNMIDRVNQLEKSTDVKKLEIEIYLQAGNKLKAFELIVEILTEDKTSLEFAKIRKIVRGMGKTARKQFEGMKFFNSLTDLVKIDEKSETNSSEFKHSVKQFYPPNIAIPKNQFFGICKNANITDFESTADDLFKCLTLNQKSSKNHGKLVPPKLFQCFYNNWILYSSHFNEDEINVNELLDEVLLTMTTDSCVKIDDFGQGRILLTQMRLLFIPFGKKYLKVIIDFSIEILTRIKIDRRIRGFGKLTEVLEITKANNSKKIVMWLPENIEIWYNLISEVSLANKLSNEEKDKTIQDKMTDQCLVYENIISCSRINSYFKKHSFMISKIMLTYSNNSDNNKNGNSEIPGHRKYLLTKLMPSPKETVTIDCATTIYKPILQNSDLWCALSKDDKYYIKIFQIIDDTFQFLQEDEIEFMSRIKLMVYLTGSTKMVVGCNNGTVYLIDTSSLERKEFDISDNSGIYPTCGVCYYSNICSQVMFLGVSSGQVLRCEQNFKEIRKILTLPNNEVINFILLHNSSSLIMSSSHSIFIATDEGKILSVILTENVQNIFNRISYLGPGSTSDNIVIGLARLPVFIEYDISNSQSPVCLRKKNLITNKNFVSKDVSGNLEMLSKSIGISSIISIHNEGKFWVIYKDGTVEIRNSKKLDKVDAFGAHSGAMSGGLLCELKNTQIVVTLGKDDGKVILWNIRSA